MRHTVKLHGVIVGYSELEHTERDLGRAWGKFRPGLGYELIQPIFKLFTEAVPMRGGEPMDEPKLERFLAARDRLGLEIFTDDGILIPASVIHIADYPDSLELDVLISDEGYWEMAGR
jgi:hypothetical protein